MKKVTKALYGTVAILKGHCKQCKTTSFIIDGRFTCCDDLVVKDYTEQVVKRETEGERKRSYIPLKLRKSILEKQNNLCRYCDEDLDSFVWNEKRSKHIKIKIHFDHFCPWNYSRDNRKTNLYASCHICNLIKSNKHFYDFESARKYINERRKEKGYL